MHRIGFNLLIGGLGILLVFWMVLSTKRHNWQNTGAKHDSDATFSLSYNKGTIKVNTSNVSVLKSFPEVTRFYVLCDASAAVALDGETFVVGDDEDNVLRIYNPSAGGQPISSLDLSGFLEVDPNEPEVDIEGADRIGDQIFWISSHGRNVKGKEAPSRHRFFATTIVLSNHVLTLRPIGRPYSGLLRDMLGEPRLAPFDLAAASSFAPKSPGALNIEGLAATPEGHLLIGFRNPIPQGRALLVPLLNPQELIQGSPARFGDPILLDLDGRGIRSMTFWLGQYFIVAGSSDQGGRSEFFMWDGMGTPQLLNSIIPSGLNPEAVAFWDELGVERLYIVSDDGTEPVLGKECKKLKNSAWKQFRALCLNPSADVAQVP